VERSRSSAKTARPHSGARATGHQIGSGPRDVPAVRGRRPLACPGACLGICSPPLGRRLAAGRGLGPWPPPGSARRKRPAGDRTTQDPPAHHPGAAGKTGRAHPLEPDNAPRTHYDEYLRLGYGIGSGAVESAHKPVVHARPRQAGRRGAGSEAGARRLLARRLLLLNDNWDLLGRRRMISLAAA